MYVVKAKTCSSRLYVTYQVFSNRSLIVSILSDQLSFRCLWSILLGSSAETCMLVLLNVHNNSMNLEYGRLFTYDVKSFVLSISILSHFYNECMFVNLASCPVLGLTPYDLVFAFITLHINDDRFHETLMMECISLI